MVDSWHFLVLSLLHYYEEYANLRGSEGVRVVGVWYFLCRRFFTICAM